MADADKTMNCQHCDDQGFCDFYSNDAVVWKCTGVADCKKYGSKTMPKLRGCPFCGSNDICMHITTTKADIWCGSCYAGNTRRCFEKPADCLADARESFGADAIEAWNRRVEVMRPPVRIKARPKAKLYWKPVVSGESHLTCSACDSHLGCREDAKYCPECGAKFIEMEID